MRSMVEGAPPNFRGRATIRRILKGALLRPERKLPPDTDIAAYLRSLPPEWRRRALELLTSEERDSLDRDWGSWAHAGQRAPATCPDGSDWRTWVLMAGRGFGKTRAGAQWLTDLIAAHAAPLPSAGEGLGRGAVAGAPLRIALIGATFEEARAVMVEGQSGLLAVADAWVSDWHPSRRKLTFRTGAEAVLYSGNSPEALRGPEHHLAWCDELAKWDKAGECWDMLQLGLRLGPQPRVLVTTTPRPGPVLRRIMSAPGTIVTGGPTQANPHLPRAYLSAVEQLYAGTRLGRQELDGELLTDTPGALWTVELLERSRRSTPPPLGGEGRGEGAPTNEYRPPSAEPLPAGERGFTKIVIGVDPPSGDGTCGIIACARDGHGIAHVLADHSVTALSPEGWARAAANAAAIHSSPFPGEGRGPDPNKDSAPASLSFPGEGRGPDPNKDSAPASAGAPPVTIIAEKNQGGAMVRTVLLGADPRLNVKLVTATVGKSFRAEPVARLFEAGKVVMHARFPELEAELLGMIAGGGYEGPGISPDRADAMVWALTELMLGPERGVPRIAAI